MILLASPSFPTVAHWQAGLVAFAPVAAVNDLSSLERVLSQRAPHMLLLDLEMPELEAPDGVARLRQLAPETRIVAISGPIPDHVELELFLGGVRGCVRHDAGREVLKRVVVAVGQGELWIRRSMTPRLIDALREPSQTARPAQRPSASHLSHLTQREREIAALIGTGSTNKQIARELDITERTVKAHLTGIFRKLGIADRLKLALQVTGRVHVEQ